MSTKTLVLNEPAFCLMACIPENGFHELEIPASSQVFRSCSSSMACLKYVSTYSLDHLPNAAHTIPLPAPNTQMAESTMLVSVERSCEA